MIACVLSTKRDTCKDEHRTNCNGLIIGCPYYDDGKKKEDKKKDTTKKK